jgi:hypothetical protein
MSRKRLLEEVVYRPDPTRVHLDIDPKLQERHNAERARRIKADAAKGGLPCTDAAMNEALARAEANARTSDDATVLAMAREMRRIIEGRRRGAQKPRKPSEKVTQRIKATLQAFSELSSKLQKYPRGNQAVEQLLKAVSAMGHQTNEDTLAKDIARVRPLIRLIQQGKALPFLTKPTQEGRILPPAPPPSEQTRLEQEVGRRAVALAEARTALIGLIQRRFWEIS